MLKNKTQKGFISVLVIIVIAVVVSAGAGVVLYKQKNRQKLTEEKIIQLTANLSEALKKNEDAIITENEEVKSEQKPQLTEEKITQPESEQKKISQREFQQEIEQQLEKAKLETERVKQEAKRVKAEAERLETERLRKEAEEAQRLVEEQKRQEELEKQKEVERLAEAQKRQEEEAQRLVEEERQRESAKQRELERLEAQKKQEAEDGFQRIKSAVNYYSGQIGSIEQDTNQRINAFKIAVGSYKVQYQNQIDLAASIYEPEMERLHKEIMNEGSKGLWTNCILLGELSDYQNGYYRQYSTALTNTERTFDNDIKIAENNPSYAIISGYDLNDYENWLNELLEELNVLSISNKTPLRTEINNLITKLDSIRNLKNFNVSISHLSPSSKLSTVKGLLQKEWNLFLGTSCGNVRSRPFPL